MTATPTEPTDDRTQTLAPARLVWETLTSPKTLMVSAACLGLVMALGTYVTQGASPGELLTQRTFAGAQALRGLGLNELTSSWLALALGLIVALNLLGLLLRRVWLTPPARRGWSGPAVDHASGTAALSLEEALRALDGRLGRASLTSDGLVARSGYWAEGLIVCALGLLVLVASLVVNDAKGMEARLQMAAGAAGAARQPTLLQVP